MEFTLIHYEIIQLLLIIVHYGGIYTFPLWVTFLPLLILLGAVVAGAFLAIIFAATGGLNE